MKIDFNDGLSLTSEKYKNLFSDLRVLLNNYKNNSKKLNIDTESKENFQFLINEINQLLVLNSEKNILYLDKIIKNIDSHKILKKIDLDIAYEILKSKLNLNTRKVFRNENYKKLRQEFKLKSIVNYKNEYYK